MYLLAYPLRSSAEISGLPSPAIDNSCDSRLYPHRLRPFLITTFMLGGGGFPEVRSQYIPTRQFICNVGVAITASATLSVALGPVTLWEASLISSEPDFPKILGHGFCMRSDGKSRTPGAVPKLPPSVGVFAFLPHTERRIIMQNLYDLQRT